MPSACLALGGLGFWCVPGRGAHVTSPQWTLDAASLLGVPGPHHRTRAADRLAARRALWVVLPEEEGTGCLHVDPPDAHLCAPTVCLSCVAVTVLSQEDNVMLSPGTYRPCSGPGDPEKRAWPRSREPPAPNLLTQWEPEKRSSFLGGSLP